MGVLPLANYSILVHGLDISRRPKHAFRLSSPESIPHEHQHHHFQAETARILEIWIEGINAHIGHSQGVCSAIDTLGASGTRGPCLNLRQGQALNCFQNSERTIIDKVLDRLQLEDPTLTDMNDPSSLIIPAQEYSYAGFPAQLPYHSSQHPLGSEFDVWSLSPYSASIFQGTTYPLQDPVNIQGLHTCSQRSLNRLSESYEESTFSASTGPFSNHSSYSELGPSTSRAFPYPIEGQERPKHSQERGTSYEAIFGSSTTTSYPLQLQTSSNIQCHVENGCNLISF